MLKSDLLEFEYIYTCLEPACGERSTVPVTTCAYCGSIKIGIRCVIKKKEGDFVSLPIRKRRHPLVEDDLDDN